MAELANPPVTGSRIAKLPESSESRARRMSRVIGVIGDDRLFPASIAALLRQSGLFAVRGPAGPYNWQRLFEAKPSLELLVIVSPLIGMDTVALVSEIRHRKKTCKIVLISLTANDGLLGALRAGAHAALDSNDTDAHSLIRCLHDVLDGNLVLPQKVAGRLVGQFNSGALGRGSDLIGLLSPREVVVLRLIADGHGNKAIGWRLSISEHTVRAHVRSILGKLEVSNRVQAAAMAIRLGLAAS